MHWEQSLPIVSSKRNPPLNLNLSMTGNYKCSNNYIELTLIIYFSFYISSYILLSHVTQSYAMCRKSDCKVCGIFLFFAYKYGI